MDFHRIKNVLQCEHTLPGHEWKGAVLFLCNKEYVFLIKRAEHMPTHGGQIAFVGGHKKIHEVNPWIVAQREYEEETSLPAQKLNFLGFLPVVMTARLQPIIPVVAELTMLTEDFVAQAKSNGEWVDIIAYPWGELVEEGRWDFGWRKGYTNLPVMFHTIRSGAYLSPSGNERPQLLWGATASMIWDFLRLYFKN
jgi:8-oxo-dGTP pyrophosphatase MutT (NUDIX family)